ncbi:MAG TPA: ATP synthase F0 subunit A [Bacteroidetes bacterium]|nr:ATP synthase F0 subunit A [Bacteroidota bacterium]
MRRYILTLLYLFCLSIFAISQDHGHGHDDGHGHKQPAATQHSDEGCGHPEEKGFDPGQTAFHHISDQNIYNIGPFSFPLPCFLYAPEEGWSVFSSGRFHPDEHGHGNGHVAIDRYVLIDGMVHRVADPDFPDGEVEINNHGFHTTVKNQEGKEEEVPAICYDDQLWPVEARSIADGGIFGGGITSFYDFSITKNVVSMIIVSLLMGWLFFHVAKKYKERRGMAPTGVQSFMETMFVFIQDEVAKPFLGHQWERFLPFLMSLFFFILGLNLFGQIPFLGGSNVTGNLAVTMVLAVITFIVVNINGNKHYWQHILWMPGVPAWVKTILTPVEVLGLFIKPITLMLRLFANITAGHMVMVIFIGLIFVFGQGKWAPSLGTAVGSTALTIFMMSIELLVAFIQAFVFTILTASYIGAAIEEAHH